MGSRGDRLVKELCLLASSCILAAVLSAQTVAAVGKLIYAHDKAADLAAAARHNERVFAAAGWHR